MVMSRSWGTNYPNISWDADHVPSIKSGCSFSSLYDEFSPMLDDFGLVQIIAMMIISESALAGNNMVHNYMINQAQRRQSTWSRNLST